MIRDSSSLHDINIHGVTIEPDSHLLGSYLNRKQPTVYRNVNMFISTIDLVTNNDCKALAHRISSLCIQGANEVIWVDSCGENSLHRLCQLVKFRNEKDTYKYELILYVQKMLIVSSKSNATMAMNNWNETPLHLFLSHCGFVAEDFSMNLSMTEYHLNFINELLKSFPRSIMSRNYEMMLPLHEACRLQQLGYATYPYKGVPFFKLLEHDDLNRNRIHLEIIKVLVQAYPNALFLKDSNGKLPLHHAVESLSCSTDVVVYLLHEMEKHFQTCSNTKEGSCKVSSKYHLKHECMNILRGLFNSFNQHRRVSEEMLISLNYFKHVGEWTLEKYLHRIAVQDRFKIENVRIWKKLVIIMCTLYHGSVTVSQFPIHACIFSNASLLILNTLLVTRPTDLNRLASSGETPLTLLLSSKDKGYEFIKELLHAILQVNPCCAMVPNKEQRWPLHIALEQNLGWPEIIRYIFKCYEAAATMKDPKTEMWPFMMAAAVSKIQSNVSTDNLTCIYSLLRTTPSVLLTLDSYKN